MAKQLFSTVCLVIIVILVASCVQKDVEPARSLSDADLGNLKVQEVYVRLQPALISTLEVGRVRLEEDLNDKKVELDRLNERNRVPVGARAAAREEVQLAQRRLDNLAREQIDIPADVKYQLEQRMAAYPDGEKRVILNVLIYSFKLTDAATVLVLGGMDQMYGVVEVIDPDTRAKIGIYNVREIDANSGLMGLAVRGTDPRGDMINQFSANIIKALFDKR